MATSANDKRARLAELLKQRAQAPKAAPISSAQERLWFLEQWNPGLGVANMAVQIRLLGELDADALSRALRAVVQRHDALRTTFAMKNDVPVQVVGPTASLRVSLIDLEPVAAPEREAALAAHVAAESRRPFDVAREPPVRATLLRVDARDHVLVVNVHHLIADAWSMGILVRELGAIYEAETQGRTLDLPPPSLQYAEYAAWERTRIETDALRAQLAYWKDRLDPNAVLTLPTEKERPLAPTARGARLTLILPKDVATALHATGRKNDATLFATLLSAFVALLHRTTGQDDLVVGTPVAGRHRAEVEGVFGPFLNMIALRVGVSGASRFDELVRRVQGIALEAFANQEVPFEKVVDALRPVRRPGLSPLFQVTFILQNAPLPTLDLPGLRMHAEPIDTGTTRFDLSLIATEIASGLRLTFEYATDIFDAPTIARMATHFEVLVRAAIAEPAREVGALPWLEDAERRALADASTGPSRDLPRDLTVNAMFAAQAEKTGDDVAVACDGETMSYRELEAAARSLAHRLRAMGIGRGDRVALLLERSTDVVVAILGVLSAGAAYVPLDPAYPRDRLAWILDDAAPKVLLVHRSLDVAACAELPRVTMERTGRAGVDAAPLDPLDAPSAGDAAYVIYTSGSTGAPKGVVVTHGAFANILASIAETPGLDASDVIVSVTSPAFDIAAVELILPIVRGARVVIATRDVAGDGALLAELVRTSGATFFQATPSTYRLLVAAGWDGGRVAKALCGGEALSPSLAAALTALPFALWNLYGPTETTIWSTGGRVDPGGAIRLGAPIANTQAWVLDDRMQPAPFGVAGELYIAGHGLALGYFGRGDLTAERFIPNPFGAGRMYRTGDAVRRLSDGSLEYLGRLDYQVKIHGHRIELGEIEAALAEHPSVADALVVALRDGEDARLVAYWVGRGDLARVPTAAELRAHLAAKLPSAWLPGAYERLDAWPLTPNGKIDRRALRPPSAEPASAGAFAEPRGLLEREMAAAWADVLGVARVGVHDDFFALGGNSLNATQVVARVRARLGIDLPVRALFEAPTVHGLCTKADEIAYAAGPVHVARASRVELSLEQERHWFLTAIDPDDTSFHVTGAWRIEGPLDTGLLARGFAAVAARNEALRTTFADDADGLHAVVSDEAAWSVDVDDLRPIDAPSREGEAARLARDDTARPFALAGGPLVRVRLARLSDDAHLLSIVTHPIVADEASLRRIVLEVGAHYRAASTGATLPSPDVALRYSDFVRWQRLARFLPGEARGAQKAHWLEKLAGSEGTPLPIDRPRHATGARAAATRDVALDRDASSAVARVATAEGVPVSVVLLAVFQVLVGRLARRDDVVVGCPSARRGRPELVAVVGRFAAPVVIRADLSGDPSFRDVLRRVRDAVADARANEDVPFATLVQELGYGGRDRSPLFRVTFDWRDAPDGDASWGDVVVRELSTDDGVGHVDCALSLRATSDGHAGTLRYRGDLFDAASAEHIAGAYRALVASAAAEPDRRISSFGLPPAPVGFGAASDAGIANASNDGAVVASAANDGAVAHLPGAAADAGAPVAPTNALEAIVAVALAEALGIESVHIADDFFARGARSIDALRAASRLRSELGVGVELRVIFEAKSAAGIAARLAAEPSLHALSIAPPAVRLLRAGHRLARVPVTIDGELAGALRRTSTAHDATPFMTALAAFRALLVRLGGEGDVTVATSSSEPDEPDAISDEPLTSALAMRGDLADDPTFAELLGRTRDSVLAYARANTAAAGHDGPFEPDAIDASTPAVDVSLSFRATESETASYLEYDTELFDAATVARMVSHLRELLAAAVAEPSHRVSDLPILTAHERQALVVTWNETAADYPTDAAVHDLFEERARIAPSAIAVTFGAERLTYAELDRRANRLASHLRSLGVGPEVACGLSIPRSLDLVVAMLAIAKAGGAYVPLDPELPPARLEFMADNAGVAIVVTWAEVAPALRGALDRGARSCRFVVVDAGPDAGAIAASPDVAPAREAGEAARKTDPRRVACVLYTSGSTGAPKGVCITHLGVVRLARASYLAARVGDVFLHVAPIAFDASTLEIWTPLLNGAELAVAPPGRLSLEDLGRVIARHRVSTLFLTTALFHGMVDERIADLRGVRRLLSGGDVLSPDHVERVIAALPSCTFIACYGPTESTTLTTTIPIVRGGRTRPVPIGRPLDGTRVYVLDAKLSPVPIGVVGELYTSGDGVASGYAKRPDLTAERFLPDPFASAGQAGSRIYRTGDRACFLADGTLEFRGRSDGQIKLRGFRIELGEIENALSLCAGVQEAVVVARDEGAGDRRIVAYLVAVPSSAGGPRPDDAALRADLATRLPQYMIPSAFVWLPAMPLGATGKIDRRALPALPAPDASHGDATPFVAPRDPFEEMVASVFAEVLRLDRAGIHDDFFAIGGHSLHAARVISRLSVRAGVEVPLGALFDAPTVEGLAASIAAIRASAPASTRASRALRAVQQGAIGDARADAANGPVRVAPLSHAQLRFWFLEQWSPGTAAANVPVGVRLVGDLHHDALEQALRALVQRHDALRTTFAMRGDQPVQIVDTQGSIDLPLVDLTSYPVEEREREAQARLRHDARELFHLETEPSFRTTLYRLGPREHLLSIRLHHIVADGWSAGIIARELGVLYDAAAAGRPAALPPLPMQYADYAEWERAWIVTDRYREQLAYWEKRLDPNAFLELPTDRPRAERKTSVGALHLRVLPTSLVQALRALSREHHTTLFVTLLSAFQALLHRYTGQTDVVVGTAIAGRTRADFEGVIGPFINMLAIRTDLSGNPAFGDLVRRVHEHALGAYAHQGVPFEKLVDALKPDRERDRAPLFQVMFILQNTPHRTLEAHDLRLEIVRVHSGTSKLDLSFNAIERAGGVDINVEYMSDLFDEPTIARMTEQFQVLLEAVVAAPRKGVADFDILTARERKLVVSTWNATPAVPPLDTAGGTVLDAFDRHVARTPRATAIELDGRVVSYSELDRRARRLAVVLRDLGVRAESRVGLAAPRSLEWIAGMLGILRAGGAYVPIDPSLPAARRRFLVADAEVEILLSTRSAAAEVASLDAAPDAADLRVVEIDPVAAAWSADDEANAGDAAAPFDPPHVESLAYVLYTSGSTGAPKGVMISHAALADHCSWMQWLTSGEGSVAGRKDERVRVLLQSPFTFDASVWEVFGPLVAGGEVVLLPADAQGDPAAMARVVRERRVTTVTLVPSLLAALIEEPAIGRSQLARIISGGEALTGDLVRRVFSVLPGVELLNTYGPTETTIDTSYLRCSPRDTARAMVPIGRPNARARLYVLDPSSRPTPIGVPGELHVGGPGVARGYLRRPELTAEKFVADPFSGDPSARLYATGDRARWLADGTVEFLGRLDHQVKLRGVRVELGEIEAALAEHPQVREAAAVVHVDGARQQRLVAYVVARASFDASVAPPSSADLREFLQSRLAAFVVPQTFVWLDALPMTPNGKVDRRALHAPAAVLDVARSTPPRTRTEGVVAEVWAAVLGLEKVGIHDNFFELGGHSLLATQVMSRVRSRCDMDVPLRALFDAPTVAGLAARIDALRGAAKWRAVPLVHVESDGPRAVSFAQQRLWFLDALEPGDPSYNIPAALRVDGPLDVDALERALTEIARRHEALRTTFVEVDGEPRQVIHATPSWPLSVVEVDAVPTYELLQAAVFEEGLRPFDLSAGPLVRARLFRLVDGAHVLVIVMHHVVSDGWSVGVLVRELVALYAAFGDGRASPLPELSIQYADFAAWQRAWLSGPVLDEQLAYWKGKLAGISPLPLLTDRPRLPVHRGRGAAVPVAISRDLVDGLLALSHREGVTLFMTLLAGFQALLARYTGHADVAVGSPIANRTRDELEGLIGFFVNTLVLRTDLSGEPTFRELLGRVREVTLGAYAHQDVPFEKLVEVLAPARDRSRSPLFQVMFVLQNAPFGVLALPDVTLSAFPIERTTSKFDITLSLSETVDGIRGDIEYDRDLFDAATIARMAEHFTTLLAGAVTNVDCAVSRLPLLGEAETSTLLVTWNEFATDSPRDAGIHDLFEEHARNGPDAVAAVMGDRSIRYRELDERANRLAHHLRARGVTVDDRVGVALDRSFELLVSLVAILKAGAAYVPLDPALPVQRVAFMVHDTRLVAIVTDDATATRLQPALEVADVSPVVVRIDAEAAIIDRYPEARPLVLPRSRPDSLAYVLFTSGSTGTPKGVAVHHRAVVRLARATRYTSTRADDVFLHFAPVAFDASTFEIWTPLANGASIAIAPNGHVSFEELGGFLTRHRVTVAWLTASLFHRMVDEQLPSLRGLRSLLAGGDVLSPSHVVGALDALPDCRVIAGYGPTENTTFSTTADLRTWDRVGSVPIGRPIDDSTVYVLDGHLQPVPVGVAGEVYAGGDGVARGYIHRPDVTAERFVPDPFARSPGARMYRTGDLARYHASGTLEFLGRVDLQVKLRGFRIELGEIHDALMTHPEVQDAAVQLREVNGDTKIVAYVVPVAEVTLAAKDLREHLRASLPEYMVPSAFVSLAALPVTANGKLDRAALPAPTGSLDPTLDFTLPRTRTEEIVAEVWATVLGLNKVGVHDNFFELGGHSLLATQVMSRIRSRFGIDVPLRALFDAPTVAGLSARIDALRSGSEWKAVPLARAESGDGSRALSFAQQRLWFLDALDPGNPSYNVPAALRLDGPVNVTALTRALTEIARRHEALRTTFVEDDGEPRQVIHATPMWPLSVVEWAAADPTQSLQSAVHEECIRPFDLTVGPLVRARLIHLSDRAHVLVVVMHHVVSDGWSVGVLVRELVTLYAAFTAGEPSPLPELPLQYADFAAWQRAWLSGPVLDEQLAYWKGSLAGLSPLPLLTDRPRPLVQRGRGGVVDIAIPRDLADGLVALCHREGVTLFMTLLAGFQALLARYTGHLDIAVGSPIANRTRDELEGLIGFFVNTLVLRTDLSGDPTFRELLRRVREVTLGAYAHQDAPFEKLVEVLLPARDRGRAPLFQVMFVLQNAPYGSLALPDVTLSAFPIENTTSKFDLTLGMSEASGGLRGQLEYDRDLFDAATIERMAAHFTTLLAGAVADADLPIARLPLLGQTEKETLLVAWNASTGDSPRDACIHDVFEEHARTSPDAVAAVMGDRSMRYGELDQRANRFAHHLRGKGVSVDDRVGVALERSFDLLVALLGILKAGAAYVPLDPSLPASRLTFMVDDTRLRAVVTDEATSMRLQPALDASRAAPVIVRVDAEAKAIERLSVARPAAPGARPDSLAYVTFTSGSTGTPKGVAVHHRAVVRLACASRYMRTRADDVFLLFAPVAFDASTFETWTPLAHGASVAIAPPGHVSFDELGALLLRHRVSVAWLTASLFHRMVDEELASLRGLRCLLAGGDVLSPSHVVRALDALPSCHIIAAYGPTENTTFSTTADLRAWDRAGSVPIGAPIDDSTVYVLDEHFQPAPIGVPGEVYTGGDGVARGYIDRPDLTAERFVPDPFAAAPGARMYRTGDLARYHASGTLEFLGRADSQVKLRGFRVELGEIRDALTKHPAVQDAAVQLREVNGDGKLVAYVVASADVAPSAKDLREHLRASLPEYMVPSAFVTLAALPVTAHGKLDRAALPDPSGAPETTRAFAPPRTQTEEIVVEVWAAVLGLEKVGIHDDFFELGGHSLLATQVMSRIRSRFGVDVPLRALFDAPTVAGLAERIDALRGGPAWRTVPLVRAEEGSARALSFAQQRLWFLDALEPGDPSYNIPAALRVEGPLDVDALERALTEIARRHEALRTTFAEEDGEPRQVIHAMPAWPLPIVDAAALGSDESLQTAVFEEGTRPFDLAVGPLVRARLFRRSDRAYVLVIVMHHVVSDGWSVGVLVRELVALYAAFSGGHPSPLPELPIQYADFAVWQRAWLSGPVLEQQLAYWKANLAGLSPLPLLTDRPRPPVPRGRGGAVDVLIPRDLAVALVALSQREGVTLFMTLLAAFQALLARYTGHLDVAVGSPIANRTRDELEGLIGFFVNTLVLRTDLSGEPTFRELVGRVREVTLGAYAHQDVPFEKLVEAIAPARDRSRAPLFQVMFVLQNAPFGELALPDVTLSEFPIERTTSKFDITLGLTETEAGIRGEFEYDRDLFDAATIERMGAHFMTLLAGAVANADCPISRLPLLGDAEKATMLVAWNASTTDSPRDAAIHDLFEEHARNGPDAIAAVMGDRSIRYRELDRRANQLAHHLRALGVTVDDRVGVSLDRSIELIVSLVAILKAGAAYVPLDPSLPVQRLAFMVDDTRPGAIVTDDATAARLQPALDASQTSRVSPLAVVRIDADTATIEGYPDSRLGAPRARPDSLAYVLFTSGSTGTPKGVAVTHRAVVRLVRATRYMQTESSDVFLLYAPLAFDLSTFEMWTPLANGGSIAIAPAGPITFEELGAVITRHRVSVAWLTASLFHRMVDEQLASLDGLRLLLAGGDILSPPHVVRALDGLPNCGLINGYGPTENTTFSTTADLRAWDRSGSAPIGTPIDDSTVYVLDGHMQPVPIGVAGEVYTGGDGVARGYIHRPDLTAERFVPDPFAGTPGARMYKTGDLARYHASGELEFLGRADLQVKLRGFRIELGEIHDALMKHPDVHDVAVQVRDVNGDKRLVAYVVPAPETTPSAKDLREHLRASLPEYMVPAAFVTLAALPVTTNGKLDRAALPAVAGSPDAAAVFTAPRTLTEERLAEIWCEVLGLERVSVTESFFDLGGHSLLATRLMSRVRARFGVEVPLRALFEHPSVAALAVVLDRRAGALARVAPLVPNGPPDGPNRGPVSGTQGRWLLNERSDPHRPPAIRNMPMCLRISGPLDLSLLQRTLDVVVDRHEIFRTSFVERDGTFEFVVGPKTRLTVETVDLSGLPAEAAEAELVARLRADAVRSFDLMSLPMFRAWAYVLSKEECVVLLSTHHVAWDAYSEGIMLRELGLVYRALARGETPVQAGLPPLPVQHSDYARWQDAELRGPYGQALEAYWQKHLEGTVPILDFPTDRPAPVNRSYRGCGAMTSLGEELSAAVRALGRRTGATLYMTLVAAYQTLLSITTGERDVTVFSNVAGREHEDVENLLGCFTNVILIRTKLPADPTFLEILERTRETVLGAFTHQGLPYQRVNEITVPSPNYARSINYPGFNLQNVDAGSLELDDLTFSRPKGIFDSVVVANMFFIATEEEGVVHVSAAANADLYDASTVARLLEAYRRLLEIVTADPSRHLSTFGAELGVSTVTSSRDIVP